jgi:hypothetical protein
MPASTDTKTTVNPQEAKAQAELLDILITQVSHLGRHAGSPTRRIASGHVETRLQAWKTELQPLLTP